MTTVPDRMGDRASINNKIVHVNTINNNSLKIKTTQTHSKGATPETLNVSRLKEAATTKQHTHKAQPRHKAQRRPSHERDVGLVCGATRTADAEGSRASNIGHVSTERQAKQV